MRTWISSQSWTYWLTVVRWQSPFGCRLASAGAVAGERVTGQRKYVNQDHYSVRLTLVQYPQWRERRRKASD